MFWVCSKKTPWALKTSIENKPEWFSDRTHAQNYVQVGTDPLDEESEHGLRRVFNPLLLCIFSQGVLHLCNKQSQFVFSSPSKLIIRINPDPDRPSIIIHPSNIHPSSINPSSINPDPDRLSIIIHPDPDCFGRTDNLVGTRSTDQHCDWVETIFSEMVQPLCSAVLEHKLSTTKSGTEAHASS